MFYGRYANGIPHIDSYMAALAHWEKVKPVRGRKDGCRPIAHRRRWSRRMRVLPDQSIAFTLHNTDVVTWHPDNSFTLEGHETLTTGQFANYMTPVQVTLVSLRGVALYGQVKTRWERWVHPRTGSRAPNPALRVVACRQGQRLRFEVRDGQWQPALGQELQPLDYYTIDRDHARALNTEYRIGELRLWVRTIEALSGKVPECARPPGGQPSEFVEGYEAARAGDFATAYDYLKLGRIWCCENGTWVTYYRATEASYRKMRMRLYRDKGALHKKSQLVMTWPEWVTKVYNARY